MAIAYDSDSEGAVGADPSWSHTCTGNDRLLVVVAGRPTDVVVGITYNGEAMTQITETTYPGATYVGLSLWYLVNPASGSNTIAVDSDGNDNVGAIAISYTGVDQTNPIDSSNVNNNATGTNSLTVSTTVVDTGCWLVTGASDSVGTGASPGTIGMVRRRFTDNGVNMGDSGQTVGTGSQSLIWTSGGNNLFRGIIASISPAAEVVTARRRRMMTGIGS